MAYDLPPPDPETQFSGPGGHRLLLSDRDGGGRTMLNRANVHQMVFCSKEFSGFRGLKMSMYAPRGIILQGCEREGGGRARGGGGVGHGLAP